MSQIRDKELVVAYCARYYMIEGYLPHLNFNELCDLFMCYAVEDDHITALKMERENE